MASSSSSSLPSTWSYRVFASFHGPDVRKTFLSHLRRQFNENGITMFDDQEIERGETLTPALEKAIRESRILIVVFSKNYASSGWCLDELLEILKCKKDTGQIVMTVFHGVDPSDVRKQTGEFGRVFDETCALKTEEQRRRWSQALTDAANIAGEHFQNWDNELKMIVKISRDVSNKLNTTLSRGFEDIIGIEAHLKRMQSLLQLEHEDAAMIVGICGPAGIGKTTIARALYSRLSSSFPLTCFMENLRGSYNRSLDEYGLKLSLQGQLLSKILNQDGMKIHHLGAIPERLCDQKVLIVLDDVDDLKQLEALANETNWFGPGSRIIVTTEDQELLEQQDIKNTYHVDFPTKEEALEIFSRYAFRQSSALEGFEKLVERVIDLCSNLPLGLRVIGSSLYKKEKDRWEGILRRLEKSLDRDIEGVLGVGYDNLHREDQLLFLLIALFFNHKGVDHVKEMLSDGDMEVELGLENLAYKSLIQISTEGTIMMHKLLQQVGKEAVHRQDPWKRQILIDINHIRDVLENGSGSTSVMGISFDISAIPKGMYISARDFKKLPSLQFLNISDSGRDSTGRVHVPEDMYFPPLLRLLRWDRYPEKCLPLRFKAECLVELNMRDNKFEKLWEGCQSLPCLKKMDLSKSLDLKEVPDLSNATNLETLDVQFCSSLVEFPSSIRNLGKLETLVMNLCTELQAVPSLSNLTSLKSIGMWGCSQLIKIPDISRGIIELLISDTILEQVPESVRLWSGLRMLSILGSAVENRAGGERVGTDIEKLPDCIKYLHQLERLHIVGCPKLASLPELPCSLGTLVVNDCESLETVSFPFDFPFGNLNFANCFKLGQESRRLITQKSWTALLPGRTIPEEFKQRAIGNLLTIRSDVRVNFRSCVLVSPKQQTVETLSLFSCRVRLNGCPIDDNICVDLPSLQAGHLLIFTHRLLEEDGWFEEDNEILLEFITHYHEVNIVECGVQILTEETTGSIGSYESCSEQVFVYDDENLSDGSYESCSGQVSEDGDENLSDGSYESCCSQ